MQGGIVSGRAAVDPTQWGLRDHFPDGWYCSCGAELFPGCDISAASVGETFKLHLIEDHGCTNEAIEAALSRAGSQ